MFKQAWADVSGFTIFISIRCNKKFFYTKTYTDSDKEYN